MPVAIVKDIKPQFLKDIVTISAWFSLPMFSKIKRGNNCVCHAAFFPPGLVIFVVVTCHAFAFYIDNYKQTANMKTRKNFVSEKLE